MGELGLSAFAVINNRTHKAFGETDLIVSASVYEPCGALYRYHERIATIKPHCSLRVDCDALLGEAKDRNGVNNLITFHLLPASISTDTRYSAVVDINRDIALRLAFACDNYLEYRHQNGGRCGVLYQNLPLNSSPSFSRGSFILQSPKVYSSRNHSSVTILYYPSPGDLPGAEKATIDLTLRALGGQIIKKWTLSLPPNKVKILPTGDYLSSFASIDGERYSLACLEGFSLSASIVPLSMIFERGFRSMALEHSLPPSYYLKGDQSKFRKWILSNLSSLS